MKLPFILPLFICLSPLAAQPVSLEASSPDGLVKTRLLLNSSGEPSYSVSFMGKEVVAPSALGLQLRNHDMTKALSTTGNRTFTRSENWKPVWGEVDQIADQCNGMILELQDASGLRMDIVVRVYDDGVGIRYEFPENDKGRALIVMDEATAFNLTEDLQAWWAPSDWDSNEHTYRNTRLSQVDATSYLGDIEP
ncbi:MAG: glycoside hydrolase family 97 N-terminal domain-containing protein, partial [Bacteroidota bacterium]